MSVNGRNTLDEILDQTIESILPSPPAMYPYLQLVTDENGDDKSQLYMGVLILEELGYCERTGRVSLLKSAFSKELYQTTFFE